MLNRISVLSLALLVTVVSVASSVLSQEIKSGGVSSLIAQLASPERKQQLEQQGNRDGYEAGKTGADANPKAGITALGLTDPAEQKFYSDAYANGYLQARLNQGNGGSPTTSPTITIPATTPTTSPTATTTPTTGISPTPIVSIPTPTTTPTTTIYTERRTQLVQQGYQDGYARATVGLGTAPQIGIGRLGLTDLTEQRIYSNAYTRGYTQYGINQANRQTTTISAERRYQLVRLGYRAGYARAKAGLAAEYNSGLDRLGLTDPTEQRIYSNAYTRGYSQYRIDQANRSQASKDQGSPITALW